MPTFGFVADDLTGASDVLAQAHRHGLEAALVLGDAPLPEDTDVVGIAGPARSLGGDAFDRLVRRDLHRLAGLDLEVLLYKVCSTFDSSPTTGSIGRGIELMHERFPAHGPIAVAPAQPEFGRFTAFTTHYAAYAGEVHRLDRHPVMSRHPSTPMREADLRRVLAEQLAPGSVVGAIHLPVHAAGALEDAWTERRGERGCSAFVVDAVDEHHMDAVARALTGERSRTGPALVVGSGGIMAALARTTNGAPASTGPPGAQAPGGPVLAVSASASSVTSEQIGDALEHGWVDVPVPADLLTPAGAGLVAALDTQVASALSAGRDVVVHTTRGVDDPRYAHSGPVGAEHVGSLIGGLAARMAAGGLTRDIAICGGDTSSHALIAMGVREVRVSAQFVVAGPVCRTDDGAAVAGCRLLLKGGQVGPPDVLRRFAGRVPHA
ncbi:four-carbon acid sugar kinase family protein [Pseudonocardia sp. MH-G8]|uniref:four-carbon acid sugar kinase family protein n=1 Tax=Pseudonocardia sp. MH-G8 TaxID=1854588 RepID=UPI000B9FAB66|nr:four-carbon acid sugar kinase family protein [Pseudonocardia sp. MH-G8]OZM76923.1 Hrp-dependent type III effector protein [Pseudonocardia sp. MH-G8]